MVKPYFAVKLRDPQAFYYPDETIPCIIELRTEKILKDPIIRVIFKGRSSSYANTNRIHFEKIFDVQQDIKRTDLEPKKTIEIAFDVEAKKGVDIPSSCTFDGIEGGKIEYMVEAILETTRYMVRVEIVNSIISIPLISKINIADPTLRRPKETNVAWPKNEDDINQCNLHTLICGSGWMRGKTIPVYVTWKQPERYLSAKRLSLVLVKQETIASGKDRPPNMSLRLRDKPLVTVVKEFKMERDYNGFMIMRNTFDIDIPSNITPTIHGNGKVVQIDYKLCITVFLPEMGPYNDDREVSANLDIVIGTVHEGAAFDISQELNRLSTSSSHSSLNRTASAHSSDNFNYINNNSNFYGGTLPPPPLPAKDTNQHVPVSHSNTSTSNVYQQQQQQQPPYVDNGIYPPGNPNYLSRQPSYPPYYAPNQILNTPYPLNTSYQTHPPLPPPISTGYQPQTTQRNVHHRDYSSSSSLSTPPPPSQPANNTAVYPPNNTYHHHQSTVQATTNNGNLSRQTSVYPPDKNYQLSQPTLPMEIGSSSSSINEDNITRKNREIESNIYPPPEPDSPQSIDMASPACYAKEFDYYDDSGIQESASDENTTLSSKNSYKRNEKTQQQNH